MAPNDKTSIWIRYKPLSLLGQGVYGKVTKAYHTESGNLVAIKETASDTDGILATTMRELAIMSKIKHRNVVGYSLFAFNQAFVVGLLKLINAW